MQQTALTHNVSSYMISGSFVTLLVKSAVLWLTLLLLLLLLDNHAAASAPAGAHRCLL
jgi:hypothetical protein